MRLSQLLTLSLVGLVTTASTASAQVLFSSELDSSTGWAIISEQDTAVEFGFDYTTLGIPKNPNNPSEATTGLKLAANIVDPGEPARISVSPLNVNVSGSYRLDADFWLNYNTSGGTTEFIGGFVGFNNFSLEPFNGIGIMGDSDGDTASDYRIFDRPGADQAHASARNNSEQEISDAFPGQMTPAAQGDSNLFDPVNTIVTAPNGTLGFAWHTLTIDVDGTSGMVDLLIDDFLFGTVDASDDLSATEGFVALSFADLFNSVASKPDFAFGVFDNITVTQVPEPTGLWLAIVGILTLATRRRSH